jgi:hypothetical protein
MYNNRPSAGRAADHPPARDRRRGMSPHKCCDKPSTDRQTETEPWAASVGTVPMGWNCGAHEQSINVGFSDYYGPALPDQWIDITDVPDGWR